MKYIQDTKYISLSKTEIKYTNKLILQHFNVYKMFHPLQLATVTDYD